MVPSLPQQVDATTRCIHSASTAGTQRLLSLRSGNHVLMCPGQITLSNRCMRKERRAETTSLSTTVLQILVLCPPNPIIVLCVCSFYYKWISALNSSKGPDGCKLLVLPLTQGTVDSEGQVILRHGYCPGHGRAVSIPGF